MKYKLNGQVNISINKDIIILKKGLWNHITLEFDKATLEGNGVDFDDFLQIIRKLLMSETIPKSIIDANPYLKSIFNSLLSFDIVRYQNSTPISDKILYIFEDVFQDYMIRTFERIGKSVSEIDKLISDEILEEYNPQKTQKDFLEIQKIFSNFSEIVVVLTQPRIRLMHKINKVCKKMDISLILSFMDNNFLNILSIDYLNGGCFECFEKQAISRLDSFIDYSNYLTNLHLYESNQIQLSNYLLIYSLVSSISDKNLASSFKIYGKIISIFLPTFEFHLDNLMRIPNCSCCGILSVNLSKEYNISTKEMIKELLENEYK